MGNVEPSPPTSSQLVQNTPNSEPSSQNTPNSESTTTVQVQSRLNPLELPVFDGNGAKFEDFWSLFISPVDKNNESVNVKMARLRQSLSGAALQAIQGLGVSQPEYEGAKKILTTKYGGQRRQLQAYLDHLEAMAQLKSNDVKGFEKLSDLVRVSVVKLQAE